MENRPKLELQLNQPTKLKLLKAKPYEGSNGFGAYYLYTVEHEGIQKAFFASPEIHEQISNTKLSLNAELVLTKTAVQNGKKIQPEVSVQVLSGGIPSNGTSQSTEDGFRDVMERCLREAVSSTQAVNTVTWTTENITSIALTMFIQRSKAH